MQKLFLLTWVLAFLCSGCQQATPTGDRAFIALTEAIDSLLQASVERPFSGVVMVHAGEAGVYFTGEGLDAEQAMTDFAPETAFVIGSLSKQVTATLVLREAQRGNLNLQWRIGAYLPRLVPGWKDTVTVGQLLNHTHGIVERDAPLAFAPGTDFAYSNLGYQLLAEVLEATTERAYAELVAELFANLEMHHAGTDAAEIETSVGGYYRNPAGAVQPATNTFADSYLPAAYLLASAGDLVAWNIALHQGAILDSLAYATLTTPLVRQQHALFGDVGYASGLRVLEKDGLLEIGHTGYVPGYVALNLYYPAQQVTLVVMENLDWRAEALPETFAYELGVRALVRRYLMSER